MVLPAQRRVIRRKHQDAASGANRPHLATVRAGLLAGELVASDCLSSRPSPGCRRSRYNAHADARGNLD